MFHLAVSTLWKKNTKMSAQNHNNHTSWDEKTSLLNKYDEFKALIPRRREIRKVRSHSKVDDCANQV